MGRAYVLALLVVVSSRVGAERVDALGPCGPVDRPYDPVEVAASKLPGLKGTPIARLAVVAFRGGHGRPIPFQVDQRSGHKLALPEGSEPTRPAQPAVGGPADRAVL